MEKKISELPSLGNTTVGSNDFIPMVNTSTNSTLKADVKSIVGAGMEESKITSIIIPNTTSNVASSDYYEPKYFYEYDPNAYGYFIEINYIGAIGGQHDIDFRWYCASNETKTIQNEALTYNLNNNSDNSSKWTLANKYVLKETITGVIKSGSTDLQTFIVSESGDFTFTDLEVPDDSDNDNYIKATSGSIEISEYNGNSRISFSWDDIFDINKVTIIVSYSYKVHTTLVSGSLIVRNENKTIIKTIGYTDTNPNVVGQFNSYMDGGFRSRIYIDPFGYNAAKDPVLKVLSSEICPDGFCADSAPLDSALNKDQIVEVKCSAFFIDHPPIGYINEPAMGYCHGTSTIHKLKLNPPSYSGSYLGVSGIFGDFGVLGNITSESFRKKTT